jgi:hypothetical protein
VEKGRKIPGRICFPFDFFFNLEQSHSITFQYVNQEKWNPFKQGGSWQAALVYPEVSGGHWEWGEGWGFSPTPAALDSGFPWNPTQLNKCWDSHGKESWLRMDGLKIWHNLSQSLFHTLGIFNIFYSWKMPLLTGSC